MGSILYVYEPIVEDETRLLQIHKADGNVLYDLITFKDADAPPYQALSHVWGDAHLAATSSIVIDRRVVSIRSNLSEALQYLTPSIESRHFIWIDAICIDQENSREKSAQVKKIDRIFKKAHTVVVWLGLPTTGMHAMFDSNALDDLDRNLKDLCKQEKRAITPDELTSYGLPPRDDSLWSHLAMLCTRPWFERGWVIQEVVLAKSVVVACGDHRIQWSLLHSIGESLRETKIGDYLREGGLELLWPSSINELDATRGQHQTHSFNLGDLLTFVNMKKVSKPIDRVYCLYGLFPNELKERIRVDYDLEEVYWKPIVELLRYSADHDFDFRLLPTRFESADHRTPSWCPELNGDLRPYTWDPNLEARFANLNCRTENKFTRIDPTGGLMEIRGFQFDIIKDVVNSQKPNMNRYYMEPPPHDALEKFVAWEEEFWMKAQKALKGSPTQQKEQYVQFLSGSRVDRQIFEEFANGEDLVRGFELLKEAVIGATNGEQEWSTLITRVTRRRDNTSNLKTWEGDDDDRRRFRLCLDQLSSDPPSKYFTTNGGRIGAGTTRLRPGDMLCVFYGAKTNFILRANPGSATTEFLGRTWVHGLGKLSHISESSRGHDQIFKIK